MIGSPGSTAAPTTTSPNLFLAELLARLRALARRPRDVRMPVLAVGELRLDRRPVPCTTGTSRSS